MINITFKICTLLEKELKVPTKNMSDEKIPCRLSIYTKRKSEEFLVTNFIISEEDIEKKTFKTLDDLLEECKNFKVLAIFKCYETEEGILFHYYGVEKFFNPLEQFVKFLN
jgi:hypothetical protein